MGQTATDMDHTAIAQPGSKALIVGLGATGLSCARYLAGQGVQVAIADSREQPPGLDALRAEQPDTALFLGPFDPALFSQAELLVLSPGVPLATPAVQQAIARGVPVVGDIELFVCAAQAPIVAITGSNGKSTVTTLLGAMAQAAGRRCAIGGNLGTPALELLDPAVELYVLELSSFQLETTHSLHAAVATVLNVSADHLDRYADIEGYAAAKAKVMQGAGVGVYNADDERVMAMQGSADALFFTLGLPMGPKVFGVRNDNGSDWLCWGERPLLRVDELLIPGRHNQANALAALAMGTALGLDEAAMLTALRGFRGLPHRTEFIAEIDGVRWYNDSKGTNIGACIAALEGLHTDAAPRTVLIAGGDCKEADFSELAAVIERCARQVILIGRDAPLIEQALAGRVPVQRAADLEMAVQHAAELAGPGDRVLLSPACASFDMFSGYAQRGEHFIAAVRSLRP